jgi:DNA-3-methyladenine glycosylase II
MGFGLPARPAAAELARIAADWSPWRGVAARLLWAYYAAAKAREGAPL